MALKFGAFDEFCPTSCQKGLLDFLSDLGHFCNLFEPKLSISVMSQSCTMMDKNEKLVKFEVDFNKFRPHCLSTFIHKGDKVYKAIQNKLSISPGNKSTILLSYLVFLLALS